jgi:hypothetical protein
MERERREGRNADGVACDTTSDHLQDAYGRTILPYAAWYISLS